MEVSVDTSGIDRILKNLDDLPEDEDGNVSLDVPAGELFPDAFMQKHTGFASLEAFVIAGGVDPENVNRWEDFDTNEFTSFVAKHTRFANFQELYAEAGKEHFAMKIFGE